MNRMEHLLSILGEECSEVAQMTSKSNRFGLTGQRDMPASNAERLRVEINDVLAVARMVEAEGNINLEADEALIKEKQEKVEKYLLYSKELGTLTP